ncbi:hypothetical protein ACNPM1_08810 [Enterobacter pseudoroggenkampii]|uniref:hypothetical protein n=1 Tax=Enterobacter pseudoroggenkampii TaxID=2996112 RepID=UPI0004670882|nr:hypothetical protein [Enterobacter pseudoroggenkampii]MCX8288354.1 hypothetical protein [Enterobacter pseudoroggenkampii]
MMNELIALILPHKAVFYYDGLALGVMLALMAVYIDLSFDYRNKKHWCTHNKLQSLKDSPEIYQLYMSIRNPSRRNYFVSVPLKFFTDFKTFLMILAMYLGSTVLTMSYAIYH